MGAATHSAAHSATHSATHSARTLMQTIGRSFRPGSAAHWHQWLALTPLSSGFNSAQLALSFSVALFSHSSSRAALWRRTESGSRACCCGAHLAPLQQLGVRALKAAKCGPKFAPLQAGPINYTPFMWAKTERRLIYIEVLLTQNGRSRASSTTSGRSLELPCCSAAWTLCSSLGSAEVPSTRARTHSCPVVAGP